MVVAQGDNLWGAGMPPLAAPRGEGCGGGRGAAPRPLCTVLEDGRGRLEPPATGGNWPQVLSSSPRCPELPLSLLGFHCRSERRLSLFPAVSLIWSCPCLGSSYRRTLRLPGGGWGWGQWHELPRTPGKVGRAQFYLS